MKFFRFSSYHENILAVAAVAVAVAVAAVAVEVAAEVEVEVETVVDKTEWDGISVWDQRPEFHGWPDLYRSTLPKF